MDPSGAGTCAQIARQDANRKLDDINTMPVSHESGGTKTFDPVDVETSKHKKGWRKIVRNFTPSYVIFFHGIGINGKTLRARTFATFFFFLLTF